MHAAIALLAAVQQRHHTGRGQAIEVPMFETMVQFTLGDHVGGYSFEPQQGPAGYARTLTRERRPYPTRDGHVCAIIYTDRHWKSFFELVGQPGRFESDPRVSSFLARTTHAKELYREVGEHLKMRDTAAWLADFATYYIPAAPLHTLDSVMRDPHLEATGFFQEVDHPTEGRLRQMSVPTRWSDWTPPAPGPAPTLGQHTEEVLREVGVEPAAIQRLKHGKATAV